MRTREQEESMLEGISSRELARAASNTSFDTAPDSTKAKTIEILLDTLAVFSAGSGRPKHRALAMIYGDSPGGATVLGRAQPSGAAQAAFLNGTTPTVYQMDEGHRISRGHPGIHVIPAVLAFAEEKMLPSRELLSAIIVGYEIAVRVGVSLGGVKGAFHPHGNWPVIGTAAAVAYLASGHDALAIERAIDASAAVTLFADRTSTKAGHGIHHLHPAIGTSIGLQVGEAAAVGFDGSPGALEHFFGPTAGADFDPAKLLDGVDMDGGCFSRYEIDNNYIKLWAACGHTHTAINSIEQVIASGKLTAETVERVKVRTFAAAASLNLQDVDSDLAARYSIPYVLAAAIRDGAYDPDSLSDEAVRDPEIRRLAHLIEVEHDPSLDEGYPLGGRPLELVVEYTDGTSQEAAAYLSAGDSEMPASRERVVEKARLLLSRRYDARAAEDIIAAVLELETGARLGRLSMALRDAARRG